MDTELGKVLILDGNPDFLRATADPLAMRGWHVATCSTISDARSRLDKGGYHCFITDFHTQKDDTWALLNWLTHKRPEIHLIIMTCSPISYVMESALLQHVRFYLAKTVNPQVLHNALLSLNQPNGSATELPHADAQPEA